jgi:hypothetical protein
MPVPVLFGLLSLVAAASPGKPVQDTTQRQAIPAPERLHECLHPALWPALRRVHALELAYIELSILTPEGTQVATPPSEDSPAGKLLMEGRPGLFPGLAAFEFVRPGEPAPSLPIEMLLECGLHNAGYEGARAAWAQAPDLTPSDLLAALDPRFLEAEPLLRTDLALELHRRSLQQQRPGALTHGSIGYVIFGFLHLPDFWRGQEGARGEFISGLLERGMQGPLVAWTVRRVLQAPLSQTSSTAARGIAMGWESRRGPVGFLPVHEQRLEALLEELEAERDRQLQPVVPDRLRAAGEAAADGAAAPVGTTGQGGRPVPGSEPESPGAKQPAGSGAAEPAAGATPAPKAGSAVDAAGSGGTGAESAGAESAGAESAGADGAASEAAAADGSAPAGPAGATPGAGSAPQQTGRKKNRGDLEGALSDLSAGGWDETKMGPWKALEARLAWTSELLLWIKRELHPGQLGQQFRRSDSLTKRMEYWSDLVASLPFVELREEVLRELQAMLADEDGWPSTERVRELQALAALGGLTPEQTKELRELEHQVNVQQIRMMSHMVQCLANSSGTEHYDLLADTLLSDIPKLLQGSNLGDPLSFDSNLGPTWLWMAAMGGPGPGRLLDGQFDGSRPKITPGLSNMMLRMLPESANPDRERLLNRYLQEGSLPEQMKVLGNSKWLGDDAYRQQLNGYLQRSLDPGTSAEDRVQMRDGMLESLRRRGGPVSKQLVLESIRAGLWRDTADASWSKGDPQEVSKALSLLTPAERAQLVQEGWLPPHLAF